MNANFIRKKIAESPMGPVYRIPFKPKRGKKDYSEAERKRLDKVAEKIGRSAQRTP